ncbi:MAG: ABC transporter substrate-binding protein [Pyrinomonadaceae bacterium]|nr:ABC transporter substrate-binding protein [Pyrinomonadaceae bacterium]MCX7640810.1 ABC transporter substrate-binding protein [Pyrinomonadaceae bacterium]MDW8303425.1 ABC transporter substrate-binding protein [Acidobacteriota bacterium]
MRRICILLLLVIAIACRSENGSDTVTIALSDRFSSLDTLTTSVSDTAADRIRNLLYNSLVKKNDRFEYVGELAKEILISDDKVTVTFILQDNVKFHNGKLLTSNDAKYTLEKLMESGGYKAASFFEKVDGQTKPHIVSIENPTANTLIIKVTRPSLVNQLLSNLVAIPIIPENTIEQQKENPIGTGPFKFVKFDKVNQIVELESNADYWEGAPQIKKLTVKTITDANALQAELQAGRVNLAPNPTNFSADTFNTLKNNPNLQVIKSDGSNVRYIGFNLKAPVVNNIKIRQAIAYAINREEIISTILGGQAKIAHSILPEESWAYDATIKYSYDPEKAKQLLQEAGYKGEVIKLSIISGSTAVSQYAQVIQDYLKKVGINVEIEPLESNTLLEYLKLGKFQMNTSIWVGGNQDPIFLRDLFLSTESPDKKPEGGRNRSRYSNPEFDKMILEAVETFEKQKAKELYAKAQQIVSRDLPLFPLWYPSNMVVASKRLTNIKINASGDWTFVKDIKVQ